MLCPIREPSYFKLSLWLHGTLPYQLTSSMFGSNATLRVRHCLLLPPANVCVTPVDWLRSLTMVILLSYSKGTPLRSRPLLTRWLAIVAWTIVTQRSPPQKVQCCSLEQRQSLGTISKSIHRHRDKASQWYSASMMNSSASGRSGRTNEPFSLLPQEKFSTEIESQKNTGELFRFRIDSQWWSLSKNSGLRC